MSRLVTILFVKKGSFGGMCKKCGLLVRAPQNGCQKYGT